MSYLARLFKRKRKLYSFEPDYVVRPSKSIIDSMIYLGVTADSLHRRTKLSELTIIGILTDSERIDEFIATELSMVLGSEPALWMNLSKNYHDKKGGKDA